MDGPALLRAMRQHAAYRHIPAVAMSSLPESVAAGAAGGLFSALLSEPFKLAVVIDTRETKPCLAGRASR